MLSHKTPRARRLGCATLVSCFVMAACGTGPAVHAPSPTGLSPALNDRVHSVLEEAWAGYKTAFIEPDGRVIDPTRGGVTTSEGQGYALLRAVWMGDQQAFDTVWHWTATNLQTRSDGLFASLWSGGKVADSNSASDADSDIALALLYAARRFATSALHADALGVLDAMWQSDVVSINGMNVLTAGNWAKTQVSPGPVINPSYFAPYAYRTFAQEDPAHPWTTLIDSSYAVLGQCTSATLDGRAGVGLPPNWCAISRSTGTIVPFPTIAGADDYGYDAFRVMWRVAVDALWNHEARARAYLNRSAFLRAQWSSKRMLDPVYAHDGSVVSSYDDPTLYGGDIGNFLVTDRAGAAQIEQVLIASFHPAASAPSASAHFGDPQNYFEQNWVWFGLALSSGALVDLDRAVS
jgi:endoglucanase